ncbi:MAG: exonuclease SbcCD subunit D [Lewinellaceae bacterium]|nr:exonuclease SbcCD subunit D [Lewinellaceae bacterium]
MRLLHFSDTHLGFQSFDHVNTEGINTREQDVYDAFSHVIDRALALKPDVLIHSGDFFHRPSPTNRALTFALEQLRRVCDVGIPIVVIAGNHETPKTIYTSPILRAFRSMPCIHPVFGEQWEHFSFGQVVVHGIPHINDNRLLLQELSRLEPVEGKFNVLMLHTSLGKRYLMEEYGEQVFPEEFEAKLNRFQYIALGHWHNYQAVDLHPNAWYSGSIERLSDTEIDAEKGFVLLDIADNGMATTTFEPIPTRAWHKLEIAKCHEQSTAAILQQLMEFGEQQDTKDAMLSINLLDITVQQSLELSNIQLRNIFPEAFQIIPRRKSRYEKGLNSSIDAGAFDSLDKLFTGFIEEKYKDNPQISEQLAEKARYYFHTQTHK